MSSIERLDKTPWNNDHVFFTMLTYMGQPISVQAGLNDGIPGLTNGLTHLNVAYRCGTSNGVLCQDLYRVVRASPLIKKGLFCVKVSM